MNFDLHTHTTYSDGKADVEMMVFCAEALELSAFAITDHLNEGKPTDWIDEMVESVKRARAGRGFPVLCGIEAEIIDESGGTDNLFYNNTFAFFQFIIRRCCRNKDGLVQMLFEFRKF